MNIVLLLRLLIFYAFTAPGLSNEKIDSLQQSFDYDLNGGVRYARVGDIIVENDYVVKNKLGRNYLEFFSEGNWQSPEIYSSKTRILFDSTKEVIYEGESHYFKHIFVDENNELILLTDQFAQGQSYFSVFDFDGKVAFHGRYDEALHSAEKQESIIDYYTSRYKNKFGLSWFGYGQEEELSVDDAAEEETAVITLSCGRIPTWFDKIVKFNFDFYGEVTGFDFNRDDEVYRLDFAKYKSRQNEVRSAAEDEVNSTHPLNCPHDSEEINYYSGSLYSRWCENSNGVRQGPFEKWVSKQTLSEEFSELALNLDSTQNWQYVGGGQYEDGAREGFWRLVEATNSVYTSQCEFSGGLLHGKCEDWDAEYKVTAEFQEGVIHGDYISRDEGVVDENCYYDNGYKSGECNFYDEGKLSSRCHYNGESRTGFCEDYDYYTGLLESQCDMFDNLYHGYCTYYNEDGSTKSRTHYRFDQELEEERY